MKKLLFLLPIVICIGVMTLAAPTANAGVTSQTTDGFFTRMFPTLPAFHYSDQASADLAAAMLNQNPDLVGVNSGTPDDSPTLAAWQTYFGQFLDHNLDFDATNQPSAPVAVKFLPNFSAGEFNLANIFGGGPLVNPRLYAADHKHLLVDCTLSTPFDTGVPDVISGNANGACDVARNADGTMVVPVGNIGVGDGRDDENQIISQMDVAWILLYNHFIDQGMTYAQARALTVGYYQLDIFTQMLPDFVTNTSYINDYITPAFGTSTTGTYTITTPDDPTTRIPVEFSVGAYRFGHSLVRNVYHINDANPQVGEGPDVDQVNVPIFDVNNFQTGDLSGGAPLQGPVQSSEGFCMNPMQTTLLCQQPTSHQITWKEFFKTLNCGGASAQALAEAPWCYVNGQVVSFNPVTSNAARQTSPTLSPNLFSLPGNTIPGCSDVADPVCNGSNQLSSRDLARGQYDGLPSGQAVAAALGCPVIPAASINPTSDAVFNTGTPLEYYVMAEAKQANTVLGCVGSKIITQVFLRALVGTGNTLQLITPSTSLTPVTATGTFNFQDLLVDDQLAPPAS